MHRLTPAQAPRWPSEGPERPSDGAQGADLSSAQGSAGAALVLHEESSDPAAGGCPRWPEGLRLLSSQGELVRGRCGSTNQCDYCAKLAAVENAELLALDALAGSAPEVWAVLTTRTPTLDMRRFYRSREQVMKALRRRWPGAEAACLVEYTTGYGTRSHGQRRPHWNLLLKGIPAADVDAARDVIVGVWCAREDAEPQGQWVDLVQETGGLMRYLALHFQKSSQKPPAGWRGHRFVTTRGYLAGSTAEARAAARASLRHDRAVWRAISRGLVGEQVEHAVARELAIAAATDWAIVHVDPTGRGWENGRATSCAAPPTAAAPADRSDDRDELPAPLSESAPPPAQRTAGTAPSAAAPPRRSPAGRRHSPRQRHRQPHPVAAAPPPAQPPPS